MHGSWYELSIITDFEAPYSLGHSLFNARVLILGSGGITLSLLSLLAPFTPRITVLRRRSVPLAPEVIPAALKDLIDVSTLSSLHSLLPEIDVLVIACALTKETHKVIGQKELELLPKHAVVVNIARGPHIDTDALVQALRTGEIAGAGLDVTDPEPLPEDSPLWDLESNHTDVAAAGGKANLIIVSISDAVLDFQCSRSFLCCSSSPHRHRTRPTRRSKSSHCRPADTLTTSRLW